MSIKNIVLIVVLATIIFSIVAHFIVGIILKSRLKKDGRIESYKTFVNETNSKKKFIDYAIYIVFIIPVINLLTAFSEVKNCKRTYEKLLEKLDFNDKVVAMRK